MFKDEATRLHEICTKNDEKIKELKFQNKKLIDDKNYYEGFVIETKKENKTLKQEMKTLYKRRSMSKYNTATNFYPNKSKSHFHELT